MTTTTARPGEAYGTEPGDPQRAARVGGMGERPAPEQVTTFVEPHAGEVLYRLRPGASSGEPGEPDGRTDHVHGLAG